MDTIQEAHAVGLNCTERKILGRDGQLGQQVECSALAHIRQADNAAAKHEGNENIVYSTDPFTVYHIGAAAMRHRENTEFRNYGTALMQMHATELEKPTVSCISMQAVSSHQRHVCTVNVHFQVGAETAEDGLLRHLLFLLRRHDARFQTVKLLLSVSVTL